MHKINGAPSRHSGARNRGRLRVRLSREGKLYVGILVVLLASAMVNEINLLVLLFGLMAGPFLFSALLAWNTLRGVSVHRRAPQHAEAGDAFAVEIVLQNRKLLGGAWSITVQDDLRRTEPAAESEQRFQPTVWFMYSRGGRDTAARYRGTVTQRGVYVFGDLRVSTRFPLGLFEVSRVVHQPERLIVYPRSGRLTPRWEKHALRWSAVQASRRVRSAVGDGEYHSLRDFRPGDNPRSIHWRTTARQGQLMVREFDATRRRDATIILDLWMPPEPSQHAMQLVELAVSFAATVCSATCRAGRSQLQLVIAAETVQIVSGRASPALLHRILQKLATVRARTHTELRHVLQSAKAIRGRGRGTAQLLDDWNQSARGVFVLSTRASEGLGRTAQHGGDPYRDDRPRSPLHVRHVYVGATEVADWYRWR